MKRLPADSDLSWQWQPLGKTLGHREISQLISLLLLGPLRLGTNRLIKRGAVCWQRENKFKCFFRGETPPPKTCVNMSPPDSPYTPISPWLASCAEVKGELGFELLYQALSWHSWHNYFCHLSCELPPETQRTSPGKRLSENAAASPPSLRPLDHHHQQQPQQQEKLYWFAKCSEKPVI